MSVFGCRKNRPVFAIIGNAPIPVDYSEFIDNCELVLRINEGKNIGVHSGQKTDILCITNTGGPARRIIEGKSIWNSSYYNKLSEVWFPRDSEVHKKYLQTVELPYPATEFDNRADELVAANDLSRTTIRQFSGEFNEAVFKKLKDRARHPFICPSTGLLAIEYILSKARFDRYNKVLAGFTFEGWAGHPWELEQRIVWGYAGRRMDVKMIPGSSISYYLKAKWAYVRSLFEENKRKW
jgi:hypothetical protein